MKRIRILLKNLFSPKISKRIFLEEQEQEQEEEEEEEEEEEVFLDYI